MLAPQIAPDMGTPPYILFSARNSKKGEHFGDPKVAYSSDSVRIFWHLPGYSPHTQQMRRIHLEPLDVHGRILIYHSCGVQAPKISPRTYSAI